MNNLIVGQVTHGVSKDSQDSEHDHQSKCKAAGANFVRGTLNVRVAGLEEILNSWGEPDFEIEVEGSDRGENRFMGWRAEFLLHSAQGWYPPISAKTFIVKHRGKAIRAHVMSEIHFRNELGLTDGTMVGLRRLQPI